MFEQYIGESPANESKLEKALFVAWALPLGVLAQVVELGMPKDMRSPKYVPKEEPIVLFLEKPTPTHEPLALGEAINADVAHDARAPIELPINHDVDPRA